MISSALVSHALKAAIRDKVILSLLIVLALSCSLSIFMGSVAVTEKDQFSVVFAASGIRLAVIFGLILFVVFYIRRSFDAKDVEFLLSRPVSRIQFLASYATSFIMLAIFMSFAQGVCIFVLSGHLFSEGHVLWLVSIMMENIMIVGVALFFSMILSSAANAALACLGFYTLSRMMGQILGVIDAGQDFFGAQILNGVMQVISMIMPRLDLMAQSSWLIYGAGETLNLAMILIQTLIFSLLVFVASALDLIRREF